MTNRSVLDLGQGRQMIDLDFRDTEGLVASYLLPEEAGYTLVETGPTVCRHALLDGLGRAGIAPAEIRHVFVTHIHLDHAGGVGALLDALPRATFYAHELGVPHLIDPARLSQSARKAWGAAYDRVFGPLVPVDPQRIRPLHGGESFPLRGGLLKVLATPGHARHHLSFFDTAIAGLFTGDSAGVRLPTQSRARPAIPPPDLDLEALFGSLEAMRATEPRTILYSHFGPVKGSASEFVEYRSLVEAWTEVALKAARERATVEHVAGVLRQYDESTWKSVTERTGEEQMELVSGFEMAAMGLLRYFQTRGLIEPS
jgi:glyoxylase-like metal-dependent hydrolase (beta-lactamase superfamily II)